jgi:hypothetical protein
MEFKAIVHKGSYTTLRQNDLAIFTENVVALTCGKKEYESVKNNADDVKIKFDFFKALLLASLTDGNLTVQKKNALKNLIASLHKLSDGLDYFSNGDVAYIENAGMKPHKVRNYNLTYEQKLDTPQVVGVVVSNKVPGELEIDLTRVEGASNYGFEYSEDGETWINGQYSSTQNATIKLPSRKELLVRARAIGTHDRKSDFCAPILTFVL